MRRQSQLWLASAIAAVTFLSIGQGPGKNAGAQAQAATEGEPNVIWSIGKTDGFSDEFASGSSKGLTYEIGKSSPRKDWREKQDSADHDPPVYRVRFRLDQVPASPPVLAIQCFSDALAPRAGQLDVNGKRGFFRIQPVAGPNLDGRQWGFSHAKQSVRVPIEPSFLRQGENEIGISFLGGGSTHSQASGLSYDSLALEKSSGATAELEATVEPTIFFRRSGNRLREITQVVLHHRSPLGRVGVNLKVGGTTVAREEEDDGYDFGERVIEVDAPAVSTPVPYELKVAAGGKISTFRGEFRPEKRWRIFAGLKIHSDNGFTDLQPNVQELDGRNTDQVMELISRFPFYKFNFEVAWSIDNYLKSRSASKTRQLASLALRDQVDIGAIYLNLLTGLCTGEELYRSLYFSKSLQKKYGVPVKTASITDVPSLTWFLPSVLADAGIKGFANGSNNTRGPILQNSSLNEDSPFYWGIVSRIRG
ncbi:MAG: hypothetical protein KKA28_06945 [Planctomycetes bacterium]|nr:hypothetical protein [Planctomycetota bacterium]MCG2683286.1 hypothetical protein [Planctomycetales bacterium]